jgi:AraC-like DNA-binding protein
LQPFKEIISYILIVGAAQGVLLAIFLFKKSENKMANRLLAVTMITFVIDLLLALAFATDYIREIPWAMALNNSFPYTYGPFIFLYTLIMARNNHQFKKSYLLHFVPFFLIHIYGLFFWYFEDVTYQLSLLNTNIPHPWHIQLIGMLIPFSGITYVILTIREALKYNNRLKQSYSYLDKINLSWITYLVIGSTVIWIVVLLSYTLNFIYGKEDRAGLLIYISMSIFLYLLGYRSLKQPEIKLEAPVALPEAGTEDIPEISYRKSGLNEKQSQIYLNNLAELMESEKPFLNNKLKLSDLAGLLGISTHNLSEVINTKLNQNFYDFINKRRVEEVKKLIENDRGSKFSILALGFEAGFSSKSAFYTSFKKVTGITPAQYRENLKLKKAG